MDDIRELYRMDMKLENKNKNKNKNQCSKS